MDIMRNVILPEGVISIGDYAFSNCSSLLSIEIPISVKSIGDYAFSGCSMLSKMIISDYDPSLKDDSIVLGSNGTLPLFADCPLDSIYIGRNLIYPTISDKGISPFFHNASLKTVVITGNETEITPSQFQYCTNLKRVTLGDQVTLIGADAFNGCNSLDYIDLGPNVTNISNRALAGCYYVTKIVCKSTNPPICGSNSLDGINRMNCTLYVPKDFAYAYSKADTWKDFINIEDNIICSYKLTYMVDEIEYKSFYVAYGDTLNIVNEPSKEHYTFSGWSEIPASMPAHDVTIYGSFIINSYILTYRVDSAIYKVDTLNYETAIIPLAEPTKEGYTFSGWSEIPEAMPANDVEVNGSFSINSYILSYKVDSAIYKVDTLNYETAIIPLAEPTKEGYTFSGWSEIPATMPAKDFVITGSFTVNKYLLTVLVDDEVIYSDSISYGTRLIQYLDLIIKNGIDLTQWEWYSQIDSITMPAHDVIIHAIPDAVLPIRIDSENSAIYDLTGKKNETEDITILPAGIYIRNGHKFIVK